MLFNFAAYATEVLASQIETILTNGYRTETGNALAVPVQRSYSPDPSQVPEMYVEATLPQKLQREYFGGTLGYDNAQNLTVATSTRQMRVEWGVRARTARERDTMADLVVLSLMGGYDPTTQQPYDQQMWTTYGLYVLEAGEFTSRTYHTSRFGDVFELTGVFLLTTQLIATLATTPITGITITAFPELPLTLPFGGE